jgi:dienelactone hydrolase
MVKSIGALLAVSAVWAQPSFEGTWQGSLDVGAAKLRLALHVSRDASGGYNSTLDSLDQAAMGIPVNKTTANGNTLHFEIARLQASFDGTVNAAGNTIDGKFTQGVPVPLVLRRVDKVEALVRPQMPKPPFPYSAEDVSYQNKTASLTLRGTLTIPQGTGPFPAAVLITGSGTHDRDETLLGHKPFLVIADYLTRNGIAVLRSDDRATKAQSNFDDLAGDALAAIDYLTTRKEIDPKKIGFVGHSEGACVGPLAASRSDRVAFVVMLAGIGVDGEQALLKQGELAVRSMGLGDAAVKQQRQTQETLFAIVKEEKNPAAAEEKLRAAIRKIAPQMPDGAITPEIKRANTPEIRSILAYDAGPVLRKLKMPVLALNGSRDIQISAEQNLPAIAAALKEGGDRDFTTTELPGLNHLFQTCKKCTFAEYGELEETFSPDALKIMGNWIAKRMR